MNNIRELFVRNFVLSIIQNIKVKIPEEEIKMEMREEKVSIPTIQIIQQESEMLPSLPSLHPMEKPITLAQKPLMTRQIKQTRMQQPLQKSLSVKYGFMPSVVSDIPSPQPHLMPLILGSAFGKVNSLLKDPSVQSVECPSPGKFLLVNKSGIMQTSSIMLTKEEISSILEEISEKTKIPLIQGLFKAALGNLIITAVISDFVGTRFIMQKRAPLHHSIQL